MKVGDLVREITRMNRVPELGLVIEINSKAEADSVKYLVQFDDSADWMTKYHLEPINESR